MSILDAIFGPVWTREDKEYYEREKLEYQESRSEKYQFKHHPMGEFKKSPWGAKNLVISWYHCPVCGVEYNTSPPSYNMLSMERVCPDCKEQS